MTQTPTQYRLGILAFAAILLTGCSLPMNQASKDSPVEHYVDHWLNGNEIDAHLAKNLTAYLALNDAFSSIASRLYLIQKAQHHLDLQYYIWEDDLIGQLMLAELLKAADRGVKVRLLIDDQNGTQLDSTLKRLVQHPNFEIKIFNPYKFRNIRVLDYLFRFKQINHRMHNKLIIADGAIAVTGGRNISREYFDASENFQFTDMDILFYGSAVPQANAVFLDFWNDELSYSVHQLLGAGSAVQLRELRNLYEQNAKYKDKIRERVASAQEEVSIKLEQHPVQWVNAHFVADSPNKIRGNAETEQLIYQQMLNIMGKPKQHLELVSAYFVPTEKGMHALTNLAKNDIQIRVLTNSFLANDVPLVHAFYQKYRVDLLKSGVQLYEFKPYIERKRRTWYEVATGNVIPAKGKNASSLHAKFFDIDGMVFVGSFNFDPRSANLNTEVGLVLESEQLQNDVSQSLDQYLPQIAYQLKLNEDDELIWLDHQADGSVKTYTHDPETTKFQRFMMHAISYLPIEWMM
ncbi:phospholipase D-like domain-containing protein [Acinetobacter towneri]|jgi:putative cardiolipin synthase|uniref:phospholipase D-like domain-containing protein n=2 Tax=Acinetobacter TaxID=469 RepID=UPI003A4C5BFD